MKLVPLTVLLLLLLNACKKESPGTNEQQNAATTTQGGQTTPVRTYFTLNPDTFDSPVTSKYGLPTGSYVVKSVAQHNGPEILVYFKGTEPVSGSEYILLDSKSQPELKTGEAYFRITAHATTYFSNGGDTLKIVTVGGKKMIQFTQAKCRTEQNTDIRQVSMRLTF